MALVFAATVNKRPMVFADIVESLEKMGMVKKSWGATRTMRKVVVVRVRGKQYLRVPSLPLLRGARERDMRKPGMRTPPGPPSLTTC